MENGNGESVKEKPTRPKSRLQPNSANGSSIRRERPAPEGLFQLAPK